MKRNSLALALAGGIAGLCVLTVAAPAEARVCVARHFDIRGTCAKWGPGWRGPGMRPIRPGWVGEAPWAPRCRWVSVPGYIPGIGRVVERRRVCS